MLHSVNHIIGYALRATDGDIGSLADLYFDDSSALIRYLVVDTGNWLPGRQVLLAPAAIGGVDADHRQIVTGLTRQQLEDGPHIDTAKPVSRQQEAELHRYFGWEPYWAAPPLATSAAAYSGGAMPTMTGVEADAMAAGGDPHLRGAREVTGYHVEATDGDIGHVENLLIDDRDWAIEFLVIDTRNWLPGGRKVVISARSLRGIDWATRQIEVDLTRARIESSPEYDPSITPDKGYLRQLLEHYGLPLGS